MGVPTLQSPPCGRPAPPATPATADSSAINRSSVSRSGMDGCVAGSRFVTPYSSGPKHARANRQVIVAARRWRARSQADTRPCVTACRDHDGDETAHAPPHDDWGLGEPSSRSRDVVSVVRHRCSIDCAGTPAVASKIHGVATPSKLRESPLPEPPDSRGIRGAMNEQHRRVVR